MKKKRANPNKGIMFGIMAMAVVVFGCRVLLDVVFPRRDAWNGRGADGVSDIVG